MYDANSLRIQAAPGDTMGGARVPLLHFDRHCVIERHLSHWHWPLPFIVLIVSRSAASRFQRAPSFNSLQLLGLRKLTNGTALSRELVSPYMMSWWGIIANAKSAYIIG